MSSTAVVSASPIRLPEFPASVGFLDRPPLAVATALRGQVVVVLLWRAGCVHSRQALADVAALARARRRRPLAVLAVHVPTVAAERDEARVRRACAAVRDATSVAIDAERAWSRALAVTALPTLVLVDGAGEICFVGAGEPQPERLAAAVDALLALLDDEGAAASVALAPVMPPAAAASAGVNAIASDGEQLWLARPGGVVAITAAGEVVREYREFAGPTGLAVHRGRVLVSDSGTHELRAIDLRSGEVATIAGTGKRGTDRIGGGFGDRQPLCSPAGICSHDGAIYVAMAGTHQIWQFDPETGAAAAWLGTGQRSLCDGGEQATFAEPLAVASGDNELFVADAGNGALRAIDLAHNFARTVDQGLMRPAAVSVDGDAVVVAAAWQPAVVRLPQRGGVREVLCDGSHGLVEPVGLALHRGELWVADAGAAALFAIDLAATPPAVRRVALDLPDLPAHLPAAAARLASPIEVPEFCDVTLRIHLPCAAGEQLDGAAPCEVDVADEREPVLAAERRALVPVDGEHVPVLVPIEARGAGVLRIRVGVTVRVGADARPQRREYRYVLPITVGSGGNVVAEVRAIDVTG